MMLLAFLLTGVIGLAALAPPADAARSFTTGILDASAFQDTSTDAAFTHAANTGARIIKNNLYWHI